jgi:hypothetical protein
VDRYEEQQRRLASLTIDANYALWNAPLTLNGIIISVFTAVAIFNPNLKFIVVCIIGASMISAALLILNFRSTRNLYRSLGRTSAEDIQQMTPQQRQAQLDDAVRHHHRCEGREL